MPILSLKEKIKKSASACLLMINHATVTIFCIIGQSWNVWWQRVLPLEAEFLHGACFLWGSLAYARTVEHCATNCVVCGFLIWAESWRNPKTLTIWSCWRLPFQHGRDIARHCWSLCQDSLNLQIFLSSACYPAMLSAVQHTQPGVFFPNFYSGKEKQRAGWESPAFLTHKHVFSMEEMISRNLLPNRFFFSH